MFIANVALHPRVVSSKKQAWLHFANSWWQQPKNVVNVDGSVLDVRQQRWNGV
jgi:hypothetical protein